MDARLAVLCLLLIGCGAPQPAKAPARPAALTGHTPVLRPTLDLRDTQVVVHLGAPLTPGRNVVYCAAFQLAWKQLRREAGRRVRLEGDPPLVALLNDPEGEDAALSQNSVVAMSGTAAKGILASVRQALADRFPGSAWPLPASLKENEAIVVACLERMIQFRQSFNRQQMPMLFHQAGGHLVEVEAFGIDREQVQGARTELANQVRVWDYRSENDFIIELMTTEGSDQMVLAKLPPSETLQASYEAVHERMLADGAGLSKLRHDEEVIVPLLNLGVTHSFSELAGKRINDGELMIAEASQSIRFRLDERGERDKTAASLGVKSPAGPSPRRFVLDQPFLVFLRSDASNSPYFAMWVASPEVMVVR